MYDGLLKLHESLHVLRHPCLIPRDPSDPYPGSLRIGPLSLPVLDLRTYLSSWGLRVLLDVLDDNAHAMFPKSLEELHRETFKHRGPYSPEEILQASWYAGGRVTLHYHSVWVGHGRLVGPDTPFDPSRWLEVLNRPGKDRKNRIRRWQDNQLLIGYELQQAVDHTTESHVRRMAEESSRLPSRL